MTHDVDDSDAEETLRQIVKPLIDLSLDPVFAFGWVCGFDSF
jgi:hypothetical protein